MRSATHRHTGLHLTISALAVGLAAIALSTSCGLFEDEPSCGADCASTFTCDRNHGVCRPKRLSAYELAPSGRGLVTERIRDSVYMAFVQPEKDLIAAGGPEAGGSARVLGRVQDAEEPIVAMGAHAESGVVVAWLDADGRFVYSRRSDERWRNPSTVRNGIEYEATEDFDVALGPEGRLHFVFRSGADRGVRYLRRRAGASSWSEETVDDGTPLTGRSGCAGTAADDAGGTIGFDVDLELTISKPFAPVVSYYDERCGDLRLAERSEEGWSIRVVDNGNFSVENDPARRTGDVGRFSSLAVRPNGNLAVAYQDAGRGRLLFASETDGRFGTTLVDPGLQLDELSRERKQVVGAFADLTIGTDGRPYIAYLNGTEARMQLAYRARASAGQFRWYHTLIGADVPTGPFANVLYEEGRLLLLAEELVRTEDGFASSLFRLRREQP